MTLVPWNEMGQAACGMWGEHNRHWVPVLPKLPDCPGQCVNTHPPFNE